jgi:S1-C subfamily serine protease
MKTMTRHCHCHPVAFVAFAALGIGLAASCASSRSPREGAEIQLRSVEVDAAFSDQVNEAFPEDLALEARDSVRRQTFSLEADGRFTLSRTVEREVGELGLKVRDLEPERARAHGVEPFDGVLVRSIERRGPTARAGIRPGDRIRRFRDEDLRSAEQFEYLVAESRPGDEVVIEFQRDDGGDVAAAVEIGSMTRIVRSKTSQRRLEVLDDRRRTGLRIVEVPPELAPIVLGAAARRIPRAGLLISEMVPGSPAFHSDLRLEDALLAVEDLPLRSLADYEAAMFARDPGTEVEFTVARGHKRLNTRIELAADALSGRGFNLLGLVEYSSRPARSRFAMLWGLLFHAEIEREIAGRSRGYEHRRETSWGMVLDLLRYDGSPRRRTFRLLWILPISFG